jgi:DNA polymerase-1
VAETILGRSRPIPEIRAKNFRLRSAAERIAQNMPMQGSAADIMKLSMLRVSETMRELDYTAVMLLTVHDELVFEVERDFAQQFAELVVEEMEAAYQLDVPLKVDVGIGPNWAEAH